LLSYSPVIQFLHSEVMKRSLIFRMADCSYRNSN
jgi:hypothetical protein